MRAKDKLDNIEIWNNFLEEEFQKMEKELEKISEPKQHSVLKDQLIWLQYQIRNFKESKDIESIEEDYQFIVKSFNQTLHPKAPFKHKP